MAELRTEWIRVKILTITKDNNVEIENLDNGARAWMPRNWIIDEEDDFAPGVKTRIEVERWKLVAKELL